MLNANFNNQSKAIPKAKKSPQGALFIDSFYFFVLIVGSFLFVQIFSETFLGWQIFCEQQ